MSNEKAKSLRKQVASRDLLVGIGAGSALEAKLIERAGFDFVWSSSLCISARHAVPDASLLSMSQYLEAARAMDEVVELPIIADCDTGYGNANNVAYAARLFDKAGIAAMSIEDKRFPKDNSLLAGGRQELASTEEFEGKIRAAKAHQLSQDFAVIARVEALIAGWGQAEALERARRYAEAGADFILIHSKAATPEEVVEFSQHWDSPIPLVLVPTTYPSLTEAEVRKLGNVRLVIYANQPLRASILAVEQLLGEIKSAGGIHSLGDRLVPISHVFELQGVPAMKADEAKYLPSG